MDTTAEHLDVLIVGAGLSGVGAACHLRSAFPEKSFALLEAREASGGTWDLFRYPGVRSDSDMFTLGYSFRPWTGTKAIADGDDILRYIRDTAREHGIDRRIRYGRRVVRAEWSSDDARWTVDVERGDGSGRERLTCDFLFSCTGYYRYDEGYTPAFEGIDRFGGQVIHPQQWPEDLDYAGKRVVVIGSGATSVTLVPTLAEDAEHVTMLQRSPSYILSRPAHDPLAGAIQRALPRKLAGSVVRWKNALLTTLAYQVSRRYPRFVKKLLRAGAERQLPPGYDMDTHFKPRYDPWDQRLCLVPDGDLFATISRGEASIVTGAIESFTDRGLRLTSGEELEADIVITATGLNLLALGGMDLVVDRREVVLSETVGYKGMMLSGVPNMAIAIGYSNASWTLKADLVSEYFCRLLRHMDAHGYDQFTPLAPDPSEPTKPFMDLMSNYVMRSIDAFPRQGTRAPWQLHQNYLRDVRLLRRGTLEDEGIRFSRTDDVARADGRRPELAPARAAA
jgi:cation diffusion facilitator CzcD-associated flavoprotein CzcO